MKLKSHLLVGAALASAFSLTTWAQSDQPMTKAETKAAKRLAAPGDPSPTPLGREKAFDEFNKIQVKNLQDEPLGRIKELGIDLVNGRIVTAMIVADSTLSVGNKIVAVPAGALVPDLKNQVYRLNVSADVFRSAPAINLKEWEDSGRGPRVAAAYKLFGHEPYFLEEGAAVDAAAERPKVTLGYVERASKLVGMPVSNLQGQKFGEVWSMTLDIPQGRILNVIVLAPGNFKTKSIIPATALSFNDKRNGLLLDETKAEFADEPRFVFTAAAFGNDAYSKQESSTGSRSAALEKANSHPDMDRAVLIKQNIRSAKLNGRNVQVDTNDGRVTLRGWVPDEADKRQIGEIAIAASRAELVDNQITVGKPASNE